jgi:co-chaperonin GroES (HSP10)
MELKMKKLKLFKDQVLLKEVREEVKSKNGLILPNQQQEISYVVVEKGSSVKISIKEGDQVFYRRYPDCYDFEDEGVHFKIVPDKQILAVVEQ